MDLGKKNPVPKPDDVKIIGIDTVLLPGRMAGQIALTFYGLGDDGKIYQLSNNKIDWVEF